MPETPNLKYTVEDLKSSSIVTIRFEGKLSITAVNRDIKEILDSIDGQVNIFFDLSNLNELGLNKVSLGQEILTGTGSKVLKHSRLDRVAFFTGSQAASTVNNAITFVPVIDRSREVLPIKDERSVQKYMGSGNKKAVLQINLGNYESSYDAFKHMVEVSDSGETLES